jgi:hypothetical protein
MEQINMCDVFFRGSGKKKLDVFFPTKKAADERWEVVPSFCFLWHWRVRSRI